MAEELQRLVKGNVLTDATAAEDFEKACKGWSAPGFSVDYGRRPALVVQPTGPPLSISWSLSAHALADSGRQ